jgi:gamma-glutamyltranspeptidase/glutathione hydrolase
LPDGDGNAVSFIHSLSNAFGSGVVAGDTGVTFQQPCRPRLQHRPQPSERDRSGRRTMHTLNAYLICRDGKPWLVGGTPGGDQQTQWSTQVITGLVDHGMSLQEAVEAPRWHSFPGTDPASLGKPQVVKVDERVPEASRQALAGLGHSSRRTRAWSGGGAVQLIQYDHEKGVLRGASDPRPGGTRAGTLARGRSRVLKEKTAPAGAVFASHRVTSHGSLL